MNNDIARKRLMEELLAEDQKITDLGLALETARMNFEIGSVKYAAVRDMVQERLGDPYSMPESVALPSKGKYRFLAMPVGIGVIQTLKEKGALAASEILELLKGGGATDLDGRAVNAALMTMVRVSLVTKFEVDGEEAVPYFEITAEEEEDEDKG